MSNSTTPLNIETHIRDTFLQEKYAQPFTKQNLPLSWKSGGKFEADAVSRDGKIVALISTGTPKTSGGNPASGKFHKIRSDALFLLHLKKVKKHLMVFTEEAMYNHFMNEQERGRFPDGITLLFAPLPDDLQQDVARLRRFGGNAPNFLAQYRYLYGTMKQGHSMRCPCLKEIIICAAIARRSESLLPVILYIPIQWFKISD